MATTSDYVFNQTMLRIKDPAKSVTFYQNVLGMTLLDQYDFPEMSFCLYFMGYPQSTVPDNPSARAEWVFSQTGLLELTHNYGTESISDFSYHDGNQTPQGFGHIGISVPDVQTACDRFDTLGVTYVKRPEDGKMKGLAFIKDPDGYWIEILSATGLRDLIVN